MKGGLKENHVYKKEYLVFVVILQLILPVNLHMNKYIHLGTMSFTPEPTGRNSGPSNNLDVLQS